MNMPDEVREIITAALLEKQARLLANYPNVCAADANMIMDALDWIDAQPAMPEPDWSKAPDWAQAHVFLSTGYGMWVKPAPEVNTRPMTFGGWKFPDVSPFDIEDQSSGLMLPLGVDWRTTLRRRPEAAE